MRPVGLAGADNLPAIPRKPSFAAQSHNNPRMNTPTSFFLARESDLDIRSVSPKQESPIPPTVCSLDEAISGATTSDKVDDEQRRRRSTVKVENHARDISAPSRDTLMLVEPLTPLLLAGDASLPSSPKSTSSRSLHNAEVGSLTDEVASQALLSSGEEEEEVAQDIKDSAPQLIMPSIRMPSRRPFTTRGRELGRLKIMVAGSQGCGKTSLIKSIVQQVEDIVHVDPLGSATATPAMSTVLDRQSSVLLATEIHASTRPYPKWWSDLDESRILRRRKSLGDAVLERNICFVDTAPARKGDHLIHYLEQQLERALDSSNTLAGDFVAMMRGDGGPQVDLILYMICKETLSGDIEVIRRLSDLGNVIPLIAKSDTLSEGEISRLKDGARTPLTPGLFQFPQTHHDMGDQPPYAVSAAVSPDTDNMDASLLMSPEYVQPLIPSQLSVLVNRIFDKDTLPYLRHSAAKKLVSWRSKHPVPMDLPNPTRSASPRPSTIGSPALTSMSASGVLVPYASDLSLTTSNSYTLARVADHTQREDRLAQVRLAKWASDLQQSLNRERERYERLARGERAIWLVERMGEEVRDGHVKAIEKRKTDVELPKYTDMTFATNDPMGLLKWNDDMRTRGWVALQVVGSFGVIGGLALWLARTWGFSSSAQSVSEHPTWSQWKW